MRDGTPPRRTTTPSHPIWTPEGVQVNPRRRTVRAHVLPTLADRTTGLTLSLRLLRALLEELRVGDDFDLLIGPRRPPAGRYPQLLAIAPPLRHSCYPLDLSRTKARLGLSPFVTSPKTEPSFHLAQPREPRHRRSRSPRSSPQGRERGRR